MKSRRILTILLSLLFVVLVALSSLSVLARGGSSAPAGGKSGGAAHSGPVISLPGIGGGAKVELASGSYPKDAEELALVIQADEIDRLDEFEALRVLDLSGSTCYEQIQAWAQAHPQVSVRYSVSLPDGQTLSNSDTAADLSGLDDAGLLAAAEQLRWLPELQTVELGVADGGKVFGDEALSALQAALPKVQVNYAVGLLGKSYSLDTEELDLSGLSSGQVSEAAASLGALTNVKTIRLGSEGGSLSWDDVAAIHQARPDAALDYGFSIYGRELNLADEKLDFHHMAISDDGAAIRKVLPYMVNCKSLDLDSCGLPTSTLAKFREDFPQVDTIWRINFGLCYSVRTDAERILASKPSKGGELKDQDVADLTYCNHAKFVDLGHNESLTNLDFCYGMPNLEVLVVAMNPISDISALASCKKLEYVEIFETSINDLSPLSELQSLRHLNICNCPNLTDISPLYGLTELERLWIGCNTPISAEQVAAMQQAAPECEIDTEVYDPTTGRWRVVGYTELSLLLYDDTGWLQEVLHPRYELLREQFGYSDADFSFNYNDPLFPG